MGIAPLARWKSARLPDLARRLRWAAGVSIATALAMPFVLGTWRALVALGLLLAMWSLASVATSVRAHFGAMRAGKVPRAIVGMWLAHAGVGVFIAGVTLVKAYPVERDALLARGAMIEAGGYRFRLDDVRTSDGPNYRATRATISVSRDGRAVARLYPEKRDFSDSGTQTTEAAIDRGVLRDLYVALDRPAAGGAWMVRIQIKPFVRWIWAGCVLMAMGGLVAGTGKRKPRVSLDERRERCPTARERVDAGAQVWRGEAGGKIQRARTHAHAQASLSNISDQRTGHAREPER